MSSQQDELNVRWGRMVVFSGLAASIQFCTTPSSFPSCTPPSSCFLSDSRSAVLLRCAGIPSLYAPNSSHKGINVTVLLFNLIGCFIISICTAFKQVRPRSHVCHNHLPIPC
jgi:hypothetical protein